MRLITIIIKSPLNRESIKILSVVHMTRPVRAGTYMFEMTDFRNPLLSMVSTHIIDRRGQCP